MIENEYKKVSFYEVAAEFEGMIYFHIHQLHIKQPYDDYFQEGLFALWKAHKMFDAEKGEFPTYANRRIRNGLLDVKKQESSRAHKDMLVRQSILKQGLDNPVKSFDDPYLWKAVQSKMTINQWKWIYQYIILDQSTNTNL